MKRFVFRLSRLERLRDIRRREARGRLAEALAEARRRTEERERAEGELGHALGATLPPELSVDPLAWQQLADWREDHQRRVAHARAGEEEAIRLGDAAAAAHVLAARDHRALERLREKRYKRWKIEMDQEEQKFLDESHLLQQVGTGYGEE